MTVIHDGRYEPFITARRVIATGVFKSVGKRGLKKKREREIQTFEYSVIP